MILLINKIKADITTYLIVALGSNKFLHNDIDKIYKNNEREYYKAFKESKYENFPLFRAYTTIKYQYIRKVAGIVVWGCAHDYFNDINFLIKKGYKYLWDNIVNAKEVDLTFIFESYEEKFCVKNKVNQIDYIHANYIAIYLILKHNVNYSIYPGYPEYLDSYFKKTCFDSVSEDLDFSDEMISKYREKIDRFYLRYNIKTMEHQTLDMFFENFIIKNTTKVFREKHIINHVKARSMTFKMEFTKFIGALAEFIKSLGINETDLTGNFIVTKEELDKVFLSCVYSQEGNNITDEEIDFYFVTILFIKALTHEYMTVRSKIIDDLQQNLYYDMDKIELDFKEKEKNFLNKEELLKKEERKIDQENKILREEVNNLKKDIIKYRKQIEEYEDNTKELIALRQFAFSMQNKSFDDKIEEDSIENMVGFLNSKKCVIIGGSTNWLNRLKNTLPSFILIDADDLNRDIKFIDNVDAVFYNTAVNNHSFYEKIMKRIRNNDTKLFYINSNMNRDNSVKYMYDSLKGV